MFTRDYQKDPDLKSTIKFDKKLYEHNIIVQGRLSKAHLCKEPASRTIIMIITQQRVMVKDKPVIIGSRTGV